MSWILLYQLQTSLSSIWAGNINMSVKHGCNRIQPELWYCQHSSEWRGEQNYKNILSGKECVFKCNIPYDLYYLLHTWHFPSHVVRKIFCDHLPAPLLCTVLQSLSFIYVAVVLISVSYTRLQVWFWYLNWYEWRKWSCLLAPAQCWVNVWSYTSIPPICLCGMYSDNFVFRFYRT